MKVSIVIPVYNAEKYIQECIESALNQTYQNVEVIAVDDGSTDKSLDILKKYQNKIKIITKKNGGTATALNAGIKIMTGEWFKWLSADDVLYPNAVEELISETQKVSEPKKKIYYSNYHYIDSKSKVTGEFIEHDNNDLNEFDFNVMLFDHFIGNGTTCFIHKSVFEKCGSFNENLKFADDLEFWLRCCVLHGLRLHLISKILAMYRLHETQLTQQKLGKIKQQDEKIHQDILSKLDSQKRKKYEKAIKEYKKTHRVPFKKHMKKTVDEGLYKILPESTVHKMVRTYRKIRGKKS